MWGGRALPIAYQDEKRMSWPGLTARSARDEAAVGCLVPRTVAHKGEILIL